MLKRIERESGINTPFLILSVWQQLEELWLTNDFELTELLCFILGSYNFWLCFQTYWEAWRKFCASLHLLPKSWPDKGETWSVTLRGTHWPRDHNDAISRWIRRFGGEELTVTNIKPVTAAPTEWRHLLVSSRNDVWETRAEIPYWWRVVVVPRGKFASTNQKMRHQYGSSFLRRHWRETSFGVAKCRLFRRGEPSEFWKLSAHPSSPRLWARQWHKGNPCELVKERCLELFSILSCKTVGVSDLWAKQVQYFTLEP